MKRTKRIIAYMGFMCLMLWEIASAEEVFPWKMIEMEGKWESQIIETAESFVGFPLYENTTIRAVENQQENRQYVVMSHFLSQSNQCIGYAVFDAETMHQAFEFLGTSSEFWEHWGKSSVPILVAGSAKTIC